MKSLKKPNYNLSMDEHPKILKKLRDRKVIITNKKLDIYGS